MSIMGVSRKVVPRLLFSGLTTGAFIAPSGLEQITVFI